MGLKQDAVGWSLQTTRLCWVIKSIVWEKQQNVVFQPGFYCLKNCSMAPHLKSLILLKATVPLRMGLFRNFLNKMNVTN